MLLYALTILVSAFLLFQVEPIIAKMILPWFGGSAAVWTVCLLFFQLVLLLGYLYAHAVIRYLRPRVQAWVHVGLLAASLAVLPVIPRGTWKPAGGEDPALRILGLLAVTVGLPYFLLSTTGPLVQAWFARRYADAAPYRLYALSNAGSMFALLSYPVLVEPAFATRLQALGWSVGYAGFVALGGLTAIAARGFGPAKESAPAPDSTSEPPPPPGWRLQLLWVLLPAAASVLLLAVTNHLSQDVAAIPFLWILPLSLYLLTFIICFERERWYWRTLYLQFFAVMIGGMAYALSDVYDGLDVKALIPLFSVGLFACCMVCHGELVRLKPHPRHLTSFYLMISAGGALGGILVGLVAPRVFNGYYELPVGLAACAVLILAVRRERSWRWLIAAAATLGLVGYLGYGIREANSEAHLMVRNFYGELKVEDTGKPSEEDAVRKLVHGTINHGEQFLNPKRRDEPTTYYSLNSGVGLAIREAAERGPKRVGVIGLGTGSLASYCRAGDYFRFYEINPLVIRLANTEFTFLKDCRAKLDVALGDARLSLEREAPEGFDVLAVDAFSGDSIPVHLLTREAFELYFRQLKPGGVLAVHVSNRYLNLEPVVDQVARVLGKEDGVVNTEDEDEKATFASTWVLVSGRRSFFDAALIHGAATPVVKPRRLRLWTDDYSNLFQILK